MKRALRILLVLAILLGFGAVLAFFWARHYLHSQGAAAKVASRLEAVIGAPVHVGEVDIGMTGNSTLNDLELREEAAGAPGNVWFKAERVHLDLSALDILRGSDVPKDVTASGVTVTLRFDANGRLLTHLPTPHTEEGAPQPIDTESVPEVHVEKGTVVLQRQGDPDLVIADVDLRLAHADGKLVLNGSADNTLWGKWVVEGTLPKDAKEVGVAFKTTGEVHVTQAMLSGLPFVSRGVWEEVQIQEGDTPGTITATYDLANKAFHFGIALQPQHTRFHVSAAEFDASSASGKVDVLDGELVRLRDVTGQAYDGVMTAIADLDFRGPATRLDFPKITAKGLDVSKLPPSWKFPSKIKGRLSGSAAVQVVILTDNVPPAFAAGTVGLGEDVWFGPLLAASAALPEHPGHRVQTRGSGQGVITDAQVAGVPAEPIQLRLQAAPGRFIFDGADTTAAPADVQEGQEEEALLALLAASTVLLEEGEAPAIQQPSLPAKAANAAAAGIHETFHTVLDVSHGLAKAVPRDLKEVKPAPAKPGEAGSYLNVNLNLKDVDLEKFVKGLGVKVPFAVQGRLTLHVQAGIPLNTSGDLKTYRAKGTATVKNLVVEGVKVDEVDARVVYAGGVLNLERFKATMTAEAPPGGAAPAPGTVQGTATWQVIPAGNLSADVTLDSVPLSRLEPLARDLGPLRGAVSGTLHADGPADKLKDLSAWNGSGRLSTKEAQVSGLSLRDAAVAASLEQGLFTLTDLHATVEGAPVNATGEVRLAEAYPYKARVTLKGGDLAALQRLAPKLRPPVELEGRLTSDVNVAGTLKPLTVKSAAGTARAEALRVDRFTFEDAAFRWGSDAGRLTLKDLRAHLYGGEVNGSVVIPLDPKTAGSVNLRIEHLDLGALAKDVPKMPVRLQGKADGDVKGTLPPAGPGQERQAAVTLDLTAPHLKVQNIPTESLHATVQYKGGVLDYRLEGKSLGGTFELDGQLPQGGAAQPPNPRQPAQGHLKIDGVSLARLVEAYGRKDPGTSPLHGRASLSLKFSHLGPDAAPEGRGDLVLNDLRWHEARLGSLRTPVILTATSLRFTELSGELGGGTVRSRINIGLRGQPGWFTLSLDQVEAGQVFGPWLSAADQVQGPLTLRVRGTLGEDWFGEGDALLERGKVAGVEVTEFRVPFRWQYGPGSGRAEFSAPDFGAQAARGRALGRVNVRWDGWTASTDGQVRFFGLDLQSLTRSLGGHTQVGTGRLTGHFDFNGREMRSLDDLTGVLDATLGQAQAGSVPVLQQISPLASVSPSTTFNRGILKARLAGGRFNVQQLALESSNLTVFAEGTVALRGAVNLDVYANTGRVGLDPARLRILGLRIPAVGPVPVTLLLEANALISNRVIHLRVTGTVRNPNVRILPGATLTAEALRYFFNRFNLPQPDPVAPF